MVVDGGAPLPGGGVHPATAATEKTTRQHTINIRRIIGPAPPVPRNREQNETPILIPPAPALKGRESPPRQVRQQSNIGELGRGPIGKLDAIAPVAVALRDRNIGSGDGRVVTDKKCRLRKPE